MPPPSPEVEACSIFPAQPPHVIAGEVRAVEHMLLTAGHWLATVDINSVPLEVQQALSALALSAAANAVRRFPDAQPHEPSCPHCRGTDLSSPSPPPPEGASASFVESPAASGSGLKGLASSAPCRRPRKRRPAKC